MPARTGDEAGARFASGRLPRWLGSTGAPPRWGLVSFLVAGLAAGGVAGLAFPPREGAVLSALLGALVAGAAAVGPPLVARRLAASAALAGLALTVAAHASAGRPGWAALAMAGVAVLTSLAAGAGPYGAALGFLGSLAYVLVAVVARLLDLASVVSVGSAAAHVSVGCAAGLLVATAGTALRRGGSTGGPTPSPPTSPLASMAASLRRFDAYARDGVRRALPLALGMFLAQRSGGRDAFWIFFAAYVVLLPTGKAPPAVALARVASAVVGVVLLALAWAVPGSVLVAAAAVALLLGIAYAPTLPVVAGGLSVTGAILLAGGPTGAVGHWALHRLVDTVAGCALALAATYLLWPRDAVEPAAA